MSKGVAVKRRVMIYLTQSVITISLCSFSSHKGKDEAPALALYTWRSASEGYPLTDALGFYRLSGPPICWKVAVEYAPTQEHTHTHTHACTQTRSPGRSDGHASGQSQMRTSAQHCQMSMWQTNHRWACGRGRRRRRTRGTLEGASTWGGWRGSDWLRLRGGMESGEYQLLHNRDK